MSNKNGHLREFGKLRLDAEKRVLWSGSKPVRLALKEIELLCVLTENPGEVVSKGELLDRVWADSFVEESNLSRHIYILRKTLREFGAEAVIETVPRRGYRFAGELRRDHQIVVERRAVTRTVIEEIQAEPEQRKQTVFSAKLAAFAAILTLLLAGGGLIAWRANQAVAVTAIKSIAVLPFNTVNAKDGDGDNGLGISDLLISRLSSIKEITVRPTRAVLGFSGGDSITAGQKLNVDAVLEGTVIRTAENIRVTARLLRISDGSSIWAGQFEKPVQEELALQNEILIQLAGALAPDLNEEQKDSLTKPFTVSPEAYELYNRGRQHWNKRSTTGMLEAERLFKSALEKDPNFALAYVGLADTLAMRDLMPAVSLNAVNRALEIDPKLGEAHATLGFIKMFAEWKWSEAEASFQKSIELNPNYATAHHWYATLLAIEGRHEQAKAEMHRALEIDPLSQNFLADLGQIHYFAGEFADAEEYCRRALAVDPDFILAHKYLFDIFTITGDGKRAIEERTRYAFHANPAPVKESLESAIRDTAERYQKSGLPQYLTDLLIRAPEYPNHSYHNAIIYSLIGDKEKSLQSLEQACNGRAFLSAFVKADPVFRELRTEPRYQAILRKMNLQ